MASTSRSSRRADRLDRGLRGAEPDDADAPLNTVRVHRGGRARDPHPARAVPEQEVRDAIIESGMEGGMQEEMDQLEQVACRSPRADGSRRARTAVRSRPDAISAPAGRSSFVVQRMSAMHERGGAATVEVVSPRGRRTGSAVAPARALGPASTPGERPSQQTATARRRRHRARSVGSPMVMSESNCPAPVEKPSRMASSSTTRAPVVHQHQARLDQVSGRVGGQLAARRQADTVPSTWTHACAAGHGSATGSWSTSSPPTRTSPGSRYGSRTKKPATIASGWPSPAQQLSSPRRLVEAT